MKNLFLILLLSWSLSLTFSMDLVTTEPQAILLAKQISSPDTVHFPACRNLRRDLNRGILKSLPELLYAGLDLIMMFADQDPKDAAIPSTEGDILHELMRQTIAIDDISVFVLSI